MFDMLAKVLKMLGDLENYEGQKLNRSEINEKN